VKKRPDKALARRLAKAAAKGRDALAALVRALGPDDVLKVQTLMSMLTTLTASVEDPMNKIAAMGDLLERDKVISKDGRVLRYEFEHDGEKLYVYYHPEAGYQIYEFDPGTGKAHGLPARKFKDGDSFAKFLAKTYGSAGAKEAKVIRRHWDKERDRLAAE